MKEFIAEKVLKTFFFQKKKNNKNTIHLATWNIIYVHLYN